MALWCSCATVPAPEGVAQRYAQALREGRLDDAYQFLDRRTRPEPDAFRARYSSEPFRRARAEAILGSLSKLRASSGEVELLLDESAGWRVSDPHPEAAPREALERFLSAVDRGDFQAAYLLLAPSWRERYTPERLAKDFQLEPQAKERLSRVRAALEGGAPVDVSPDGAQLPLGGGRAVRLIREGGGYTIASLE